MSQAYQTDAACMRLALAQAQEGRGRVEPNPMVGAIIVRDGHIVGEGFHEEFGGPHAEANAIAAAGEQCAGATLYVTLEPCTGQEKKTPPCCDAVIKAGLKRVVIGARDPTQEPAAPRLMDAGIFVTTEVLENDCMELIAPFLKLKLQGRPYVIAKWAMTADGKLATSSGDSKWISCEESRKMVHRWRNEMNAVLVGAKTIRKDDPLLTCRILDGRSPLRIVLDSQAAISLESRLMQTISETPLLLICHESAPASRREQLANAGCRVLPLPGNDQRPDPAALLEVLGRKQLTNLLLEGGSEILGTFFERGLIDEVRIFVAPKLAGGAEALSPIGGSGVALMADALQLEGITWAQVGCDMLLCGRVRSG